MALGGVMAPLLMFLVGCAIIAGAIGFFGFRWARQERAENAAKRLLLGAQPVPAEHLEALLALAKDLEYLEGEE